MAGRGRDPSSRTAAKVLFGIEGRGVLQGLIPNGRQLELAFVPIREWIIELDIHGLLDGHGDDVCLPTHYVENVHTDAMTLGVTMVIEGEGGLEIILEPFLKGPHQFTYVLLFTANQVTLETVDYCTLLGI